LDLFQRGDGLSVAGGGWRGQCAPQVAVVLLAEDLIVPRGHLAGLTLSTAGSSTTFSVSAGMAADSTNVDMMVLSSAISKTTGAWAVGTGNGALDTGAIAANTWYHFYLIKRVDTGLVDPLISLSATAPTLPTNYTLSRRIGSRITNGSSQWASFTQDGDWFVPAAVTSELATASAPTSLTALTLAGVPSGVRVLVKLRGLINHVTVGTEFLIASGDETTVLDGDVNTSNRSAMAQVSSVSIPWETVALTNLSGQIKYQASAANLIVRILSAAYMDRRGRDA
jgi:hypothetical protein